MDFVGVLLLLAGVYLVDSGVQNRAPLELLKSMLTNPTAIRETLAATKGTGYQSGVQQSNYAGGGASTQNVGLAGGSSIGARALAFAQAQTGKPYKWGATGPDAYDCSGLVKAAYDSVGISLPRTTYQMLASPKLQSVSKDQLMIGDLVFPTPGHVGIYAGNGQVTEAPRTGKNVRTGPIWGYFQARRVIVKGDVTA